MKQTNRARPIPKERNDIYTKLNDWRKKKKKRKEKERKGKERTEKKRKEGGKIENQREI